MEVLAIRVHDGVNVRESKLALFRVTYSAVEELFFIESPADYMDLGDIYINGTSARAPSVPGIASLYTGSLLRLSF